MLDNLAKRLHIPFVDEAYITGNITAFPFQSMFREELIPKEAAIKSKGVRCSCDSLRKKYSKEPHITIKKEKR